MIRNNLNQIIVTEEDYIEILYANASPSRIVVTDNDWVMTFNQASAEYELPIRIEWTNASTQTPTEFIEQNMDEWHMPDEYRQFDPYKYCISKCTTPEQQSRVKVEQDLFEQRSMTRVLQFLKYFVDTLREHDIVWGVGRGSSVASYILYQLGVHRVDSLQYNLDIKEFLK